MPTLRIGFHQPFEPFGFMEGERATGWLVELVSATLLHGAAAHRFVPLPIAGAAVESTPAEIRIELRRAGTTITISWPVTAAGSCSTWLRDLLS